MSFIQNKIYVLLVILLFSPALLLGKVKAQRIHPVKAKTSGVSLPDRLKTSGDSTHIDSGGCNPDIWKHVYNPTRLQVLNSCLTVTGVIEESNADEDGDQHMLLKLDNGQEKLLLKNNKKKKSGNLVIEAVCINSISVHKAKGICKGYVNHVQLPNVGDHVVVTGSYVIDTHNDWTEIHPVTEIKVQ